MLNFLRKYKVEIVIFILALFARSILVSINLYANDYNIVNTIHGDDGYYEISQGILSGNGFTGFSNYPFSPNPLRPPFKGGYREWRPSRKAAVPEGRDWKP